MSTGRKRKLVKSQGTKRENGLAELRRGDSGSLRIPLLSPIELASYLGLPVATIYRWRTYGEGPLGIEVGQHVHYRLEDVDRWLDEKRRDRA
jgi:predicted DNA-binding transcriptional regulator AlpA